MTKNLARRLSPIVVGIGLVASLLVVGTTDASGATGGFTSISAGGSHTCALTIAGGVQCWGFNQGALGDGTTKQRPWRADVVGLTSGVSAIAAAGFYSCALTTAGGVKCWGDNRGGALGDGTNVRRLTAVDVVGLTAGVRSISVEQGDNGHSCALTIAGGVKCWGANNFGQLGDGTMSGQPTPVDVAGLTTGVSAISAGGDHTCALTIAGGVKCWGRNDHGQLGDGTTSERPTPVDVLGLTSGVSAISAGGEQTCALTTAGGVKCWGLNNYGQLGDGTKTQRLAPVDVAGLTSGISAISAGGVDDRDHTCALTNEGGVRCWGFNGTGDVGDGTATKYQLRSVAVAGLSTRVSAISAGGFHTCALTADGGLKCWGANGNAELGDGTTTQQLSPENVADPAIPRFVSVVPGSGSATMLWAAPGIPRTNGAANTGYRLTVFDGSSVAKTLSVGLVTKAAISGLKNGRSYVFAVAAANALGTGPFAAVTITAGTPSAPTTVVPTPGIGTETVGWIAPTQTNKSAVTGYQVTVSVDALLIKSVAVGRGASSVKFAGLRNGQIYAFGVAAKNARGFGPPTTVVASPGTPFAPTRVTAVLEGGSAAKVHWTAPKVTNRSELTGYAVTAYRAGLAQSTTLFAGAFSTQVINGLSAGTSYTFKVAARNARGTGPLSAASNAVKP